MIFSSAPFHLSVLFLNFTSVTKIILIAGYVVDVLKMVDGMSFHVQDVELNAEPEIVHVSRFVEFRGLKKASYARSPPLITPLLPLAHSNRPTRFTQKTQQTASSSVAPDGLPEGQVELVGPTKHDVVNNEPSMAGEPADSLPAGRFTAYCSDPKGKGKGHRIV